MFVLRGDKVISEATDADVLAERLPYLTERFDAIKRIRDNSGDLTFMSKFNREFMASSRQRRVASIPATVLGVLMEEHPDFLLNKRKFYGWLDQHPEYCTYERIKRRA